MTYHGWDGFIQHGLRGGGGVIEFVLWLIRFSHSRYVKGTFTGTFLSQYSLAPTISVKGRATTNYF